MAWAAPWMPPSILSSLSWRSSVPLGCLTPRQSQAKHEIMIEEKVDKSRRAVKTAAKLAAAKKLAAKRAQAMQATAKAAAAVS